VTIAAVVRAQAPMEAFTAPIASRFVWTILMLAWPPVGDRAKVST